VLPFDRVKLFSQNQRNELSHCAVQGANEVNAMHLLTLIIAALLACIAGYVGIAALSTPLGQYAVVAIICAIATYWVTRSNDHHRPVH
jgi:hypothetical protein